MRTPGFSNMNSTDVFDARRNIKLNINPVEILADHSFQAFTYLCFKTLQPSVRFLPNWHFEYLSEIMLAIANKELTRVIINIPPRYLKSTFGSIALPAWLLKENPSNKIICASYSQMLASSLHRKCRSIVSADWYKRQFPDVEILKSVNNARRFETTAHGLKIGCGVNASLTGDGADYIIIDDPHKPKEAASEKERLKGIRFFEETAYTRLDDKIGGVIAIIMQRLHEEDLSGFVERKGGWEIFRIPTIEERTRYYTFGDFTYLRQEGEILHPARENSEQLEEAKKSMGSYAFEAQYQQHPAPLGGGVFKLKWFPRFKVEPENSEFTIQSWDTAVKTADKHDYSVCTTIKVYQNNYYIINVKRIKLDYPDLKRTLINMANSYQPNMILIEDKASGQTLIQDLKRDTKLNIAAIIPSKDKITRASQVSATIESGKVLLPEFADWLPDFESELALFPNSVNDDQVDSLSQGLNYLSEKYSMPELGIRIL